MLGRFFSFSCVQFREFLREKGINLTKEIIECKSEQTARLGYYTPKKEIEKLEKNVLDPYKHKREAERVCQVPPRRTSVSAHPGGL
ncbi:hypothetical protein AKJ64_02120 [candidate division MSBL1 archaeon SCGC-AAA259E17]|uniref:Uncharacterized protein n=1 Tax=candidate division MSBL1 archaeon SCGC-AAA259E17 TaxID=1698263 RepID=A0A133UF36_9EURY|nr:hypothetical protein AKJ64_02120 [candidate division MSBL1 archaeon SCGC-AAA259E17]